MKKFFSCIIIYLLLITSNLSCGHVCGPVQLKRPVVNKRVIVVIVDNKNNYVGQKVYTVRYLFLEKKWTISERELPDKNTDDIDRVSYHVNVVGKDPSDAFVFGFNLINALLKNKQFNK